MRKIRYLSALLTSILSVYLLFLTRALWTARLPAFTKSNWWNGGKWSFQKPIKDNVELVVASMKHQDTEWLRDRLPEWPKQIYIVDDPNAPLTVPRNKGREAMVYLTYIIENYDRLPGIVMFLHAERFQWHNDDVNLDSVHLLKRLDLDAIQEEGYVNLRCAWMLGCPYELRPLEDAELEDTNREAAKAYKQAFEELLPERGVPAEIGVPCCAQFGVTKNTILREPKAEYSRMREWLLNTTLEDSVSGRIFEYSWHMIFGREAVHCPDAKNCYCKLFGLCDLQCAGGTCEGQWSIPPYSTLPKDWPYVGWDGEARNFSEPE